MFFFKHKTAYEMRINDWSSDVCSSDLETIVFEATLPTAQDIKSIMTLARHHDYAVMIVDFYNTRPHQVLAANQERPERSRFGEHSIMRVYQEGWKTDLPTHIPVAYVNDIHDTISAQVEIMQFLMRDTKQIGRAHV